MIKKIRYRLVYNRSGCLNQRGEGLVQIEAEQQGRKAYFSTHTYLKPEQFARGCVVNTDLADALNYTLFTMIREVESVELDYIKKGVDVTLPMLKEAVKAHLSPSAKLTDFGQEVVGQSERNLLTKQNYKTLFNNLDKFKSGVRVTDIDYNFVVAYDKWLRSSGIAHNTRVSRLRLLRAVVNEAMERGCAVVASDEAGAVPFLIEDGANGLLTDLSAQALADRIVLLQKDVALRERISQKLAETDYGKDEKRFRDAWKKLLEED